MKNQKRRILFLNRNNIERLADYGKAISAVERAFVEFASGSARMPPKIYLDLPEYGGDFRAMPAYLKSAGMCAVKWVNVHPLNQKIGLPTVMAMLMLNDPKTGRPVCLMDGTYLTSLRTGAAGAVAVKYLAEKGASVVGLVGCGTQGRTQLRALMQVMRIKKVKIWGNDSILVSRFLSEFKGSPFIVENVRDVKNCVQDCDVVTTTTPVRKPIVRLDWLKKGVHINAIGADAPGKQELDPAILKNAKIVVDDWVQASHSGEINVSVSKGILTRRNIYGNIGEIVSGKKRGRTRRGEITVFDSTGLAVQDVAVGSLLFKEAVRQNLGTWLPL